MIAVALRQSIAEEALVVLQLHAVHLQPDTGHENRVDMRGKTAVRLMNVCADIAGAVYDLGVIDCALLRYWEPKSPL